VKKIADSRPSRFYFIEQNCVYKITWTSQTHPSRDAFYLIVSLIVRVGEIKLNYSSKSRVQRDVKRCRFVGLLCSFLFALAAKRMSIY